MHRVSDHLSDRYPYKSGFREEHNPNQISRAYGNEDIPRYCHLVSLKDELTDEEKIVALNDLSDLLASQENKTKAIANGIIPSLSRLLTVSNHLIRYGAAKVLAALAFDADGILAMDKDLTLLFNLNSLLFDGQEECVEIATKVLANLTIPYEGIPIVLTRSYIPEKLVAMALCENNFTNDTVLNLYQIFAQLTKSHQGAEACAKVQVVAAILHVLQRPLNYQAKLLRYAVVALWNLATHNAGKMEAIEGKAVEYCVKILVGVQKHAFKSLDEDEELDLIRVTSGALMALATSEVAKPKLLATGIEPLIACLFLPVAKENAIQALNYMCEERSGLLPVVTLLLDHTELLIRVFGIRSTPALNKILEQNIKPKLTLQAIALICDEHNGIDEIVQCLHMIDNLTQLITENEDVPEIPQLAIQIVSYIAKRDEMARTRVERALTKFNTAPNYVKQILSRD